MLQVPRALPERTLLEARKGTPLLYLQGLRPFAGPPLPMGRRLHRISQLKTVPLLRDLLIPLHIVRNCPHYPKNLEPRNNVPG